MSLSSTQKKKLKKLIKRKNTIDEISSVLKVDSAVVKSYLLKKWSKRKFNRIFTKTKKDKNTSLHQEIADNKNIFFLLIILTFSVFLNSLNNEFVSDDIAIFIDNPVIENWWNFKQYLNIVARNFVGYTLYAVFGPQPLYHRFSNLLFHIGSVIFLFLIVKKIINKKVAIISSFIYAIHPIVIESVVWVTGGAYAQYGFFFLLSFLYYIYSYDNKKYYYFSVFFYIICVLSSEKSFVLAGIFFIYELSFGNIRKHFIKILPYLGISFLLTIYYYLKVTSRVVVLQTQYYQTREFVSPFTYVPIALTRYLELMFWPKGLSLYQTEFKSGFTITIVRYLVTLSYIVVSIGAFFKDKKTFFWLSFLVIALTPFLTPFGISWLVAERYFYVSSMAVIVLFALAIDSLIKKNILTIKVTYVLLAFIITILSIRTIIRNNDWQNVETLWASTVRVSPNSPKAHNNMGDVYARRGDYDLAIKEFETAIKLKPNYADVYHNLGVTYEASGNQEKAKEYLLKALELNSNIWQSHLRISNLYFAEQEYNKSEEHLLKALEISPNRAQVLAVLGDFYEKTGQIEKALNSYQQLLKFNPSNLQLQQKITNLELSQD